MEKVRDFISEYKVSTATMKEEMDTIDAAVIQTKEGLENETRILNAHNEEFNELCILHERKAKELVELNLRIQKITHDNERFQKERLNSQQSVQDLESRYEWIIDEKQYVFVYLYK